MKDRKRTDVDQSHLGSILGVYSSRTRELQEPPMNRMTAEKYISDTLTPLLGGRSIRFKTEVSGEKESHNAYMERFFGNGYLRVNEEGHIVIGIRERDERRGREWSLNQVRVIRYSSEVSVPVDYSSQPSFEDPSETVMMMEPVYDSSDTLEPIRKTAQPDYRRKRDLLDSVADEMIQQLIVNRKHAIKNRKRRQLVGAAI